MLEDIIESLMKGEAQYPRALIAAQAFWDDFYSTHANANTAALGSALDGAQMPFQWKMEEDAGLVAPFAKAIMALTAIGALYRDGFANEALARRMLAAFAASSTLSSDVKIYAEHVGAMYSLD